MREIVHLQAGQCGNQIGAKVGRKHPETPSATIPVNGRRFYVTEFKCGRDAAIVRAAKRTSRPQETLNRSTRRGGKCCIRLVRGSAQ